eukprot:scaffold3335_cov139-Skeletonema_marinoi.AAC.4
MALALLFLHFGFFLLSSVTTSRPKIRSTSSFLLPLLFRPSPCRMAFNSSFFNALRDSSVKIDLGERIMNTLVANFVEPRATPPTDMIAPSAGPEAVQSARGCYGVGAAEQNKKRKRCHNHHHDDATPLSSKFVSNDKPHAASDQWGSPRAAAIDDFRLPPEFVSSCYGGEWCQQCGAGTSSPFPSKISSSAVESLQDEGSESSSTRMNDVVGTDDEDRTATADNSMMTDDIAEYVGVGSDSIHVSFDAIDVESCRGDSNDDMIANDVGMASDDNESGASSVPTLSTTTPSPSCLPSPINETQFKPYYPVLVKICYETLPRAVPRRWTSWNRLTPSKNRSDGVKEPARMGRDPEAPKNTGNVEVNYEIAGRPLLISPGFCYEGYVIVT